LPEMPTLNRRHSHRLRDFSLYILIAVAVAGSAILLGVHSARTGQRPEFAFKSVGFTFNTAFVFGWSLRAVRPFLKRRKLWAMAGGLLLLHGTIWSVVISQVEHIPLIWYVPLDAAEISVLIQLLSWALAENKPQRDRTCW
jgi:uncharacterized membrane protein